MQHITLLCIGKLKERYWREALDEYSRRLGPYCRFAVIEEKEDARDDVNEEGARLLRRINKDDYVVTLEIRGKQTDSEGLAARLEELALRGTNRIVFVIGGSEGLSAAVSARADWRLSFGPMTFPHQMMRVILAEQIYRSFKIRRGETYH